MQPTTTFGPLEIWQSMGTVGHLVLFGLFLMSVYSTGVMIDRWVLLRRAQRQTLEFTRRCRALLEQDRLAELIVEASRHPHSHVARIYRRGLEEGVPDRNDGLSAESFENALRGATERERARITQDFKHGLSGLASIAATAPFVGLFGTVIGIMNSFFGMAASGSGGIGTVAGGIAEALVNTAAGILVALPAVWGFNYFLGRLERVHSEMNNASSELADYVIRRSQNEAWKLEATTGRPVNR